MDKLKRIMLQHGLTGCLTLAARHSSRSLLHLFYRHERHIWYAGATSDIKAERPLSIGLALQRAGSEHLDLLSQSNLCGRTQAERFLAEGADLWMVRDAERAAFCCWIFRRRMPVVAARGGRMGLPSDTVCLEGSVTGLEYRGRGIAPAAWSLIALHLQQEGIQTIITKVEIENMPSRRAVLKAGFHEAAAMDFLKLGRKLRIQVIPFAEAPEQAQDMLAELLKLMC
jgi:hypothetical protein